MVRKMRTHLSGSGNGTDAPTDFMTKEEFGRHLYRLMIAKGWSQADLARRSGLTKDSISTYIRGKVFPTPNSVNKLSKVFGLPMEQIMPNHIAQAIADDHPSFDARESPGHPGLMRVRMDKLVSMAVFAKISALLADDETADRD